MFTPNNVAQRYCSLTCSGRANGGWKGGLYVGKDGRAYVSIRTGVGRKQLYSRCLMEAHLKRHLAYEEVVHHINGDPTDDRIENLTVISRPEHIAQHKREMALAKSKIKTKDRAYILTSEKSLAELAAEFGVEKTTIWWHRNKSQEAQAYRQSNGLREEMRAGVYAK